MQKEKMDKKKAQHEKSEKNMWSVDATDSKGKFSFDLSASHHDVALVACTA